MLFLSSLCLIFLLGMQQQHITGGHHLASVLTCFLIAAAQVGFIQQTVVTAFWPAVLTMGAGGAIGASLSIVLHRRLVKRRPHNVIGEPL